MLMTVGPVFWLNAKTIVVNTTNNVSPAIGQTNLVQAINSLQDGDTIAFQLAGSGPFYFVTPPLSPANGYPAITNNNITIDGYTQPGAFPNTNTILGSNTAQIQIVLDSRAGGCRAEDISGLSLEEASGLLIKGATNVTIRGLDFLGPGTGSGTEDDPATYAISFALGSTNGHVNGCWFGVAPDRTNVFRFQDAVTTFQGDGFGNDLVIGVEKSAPDAATARSQFNVMVGEYIPLGLEGSGQRIAGNFFNVFPDGVTDYNIDGNGDHTLQAFIEIGRGGDNLLIGTDGDGNHDADERNVFGGVTRCDDSNLLEWYGCTSRNTVIAGNYFGLGGDGVTRFTNSMTLLGGLNSSTTLRLGSDFDGVSDAVEGNVISLNYPFDALYPSPASSSPPDFSIVQPGAAISFRGNTLLGAELMPFTYADGLGDNLPRFEAYGFNYISTPYFPVLSPHSTQTRLCGTVPAGVAPFTNIVIDVYLADEEAWTNGQAFQFPELAYTDPATDDTDYYGFAEGKIWLAAFDLDSPANLDSAPGQFAFDIHALNIPANALVTVAASYTTNTIGTQDAVMHTGPFALPVTLPAVPYLSLAVSGTNLLFAWPTNAGLFTIQTTPGLAPAVWSNLQPPPAVEVNGTNYQAKMIFS
ncbi:MAG TPA: hypothetical protein VGO57_05680, partial [Verrucomicrobiae bacterium]